MSDIVHRGALIVLEGCDRSGKTTQGLKLVKRLNDSGISAEFMRFPDRSTTCGKLISQYLSEAEDLEDHSIHLLFSANRWELVPKMKKLIESGTTLIIDRYAFSGVAFSSVKENMTLEWCKKSDVGLPKPDAVLYLDLTIEKACKRGEFGGERYENKQIQIAVRDTFMKLKEDYWKIINADKTVEELHEEMYEVCESIITRSKQEPLGKLWTSD